MMNTQPLSIATAVGGSFLDRQGQRWWVKGPRPGSSEQFIVEAQMKGAYPRVALYVMTDQEFRDRAAAEGLRREESPAAARRGRARAGAERPQAR